MSYFSIKDTNLPYIIINRNDCFKMYPKIGNGGEGTVLKYNDELAIKIFDNSLIDPQKNKFEKIEKLALVNDESFCFPKGLVGYEDLKKQGYYMDIVIPNEEYKNFDDLMNNLNFKTKINYIIQASLAIKRIHNKNIYIGDLRGNNIMIDELDNIRFVDTDNYKYQDYDFSIRDYKLNWAYNTYNKKFNDSDNDIFIFTIISLICLTKLTFMYHENKFTKKLFIDIINSLDISKEEKNGLKLILSDADNKPYLDEIFDCNVNKVKVKS